MNSKLKTITIPISYKKFAYLTGEFPMTKKQFDEMMEMIESYKISFVKPIRVKK